MIPEYAVSYSIMVVAVPVVALTVEQVRAIFQRDRYSCAFPFEHVCEGKLTVHHIFGKDSDPSHKKEDSPDNLITVCHEAHWKYLHNGASEEETKKYQHGLSEIAKSHTDTAQKHGWEFPL